MNKKYTIVILIINASLILKVQSNDCDNIIDFYKVNNLPYSKKDCCQWTNIQCFNNNIQYFRYVDDNNIKIDFSNFPIFEELSELIIQGKYILGGTVPYSFFIQPKLKTLILENSNIWEIPNIINPVVSSSIETLSLKNNLLTTFPYYLRNMPNLKNLNLSENKISGQLSSEINQFPFLEILNISSNFFNGKLPEMPSGLRELYIGNNQFSSLEISSSQTPNLELFNGDNTNLGDSSFQILTEFPNLKNISLENAGLTKIPQSIKYLDKLETLSLKNNNIEYLPNEFEQLNSLEEINISGNKRLNGKIKNNFTIKNCYISNTNVCIEDVKTCKSIDNEMICGGRNSSNILLNILIVILIIIITGLIGYIVNYLYKLKKDNDLI